MMLPPPMTMQISTPSWCAAFTSSASWPSTLLSWPKLWSPSSASPDILSSTRLKRGAASAASLMLGSPSLRDSEARICRRNPPPTTTSGDGDAGLPAVAGSTARSLDHHRPSIAPCPSCKQQFPPAQAVSFATSAARSSASLTIPSPSASRTKVLTVTGAPAAATASARASFTFLSVSITQVCSSSTLSS